MNKFLLIAIALLVLVGIVGFLMPADSVLAAQATNFLAVAQLMAIIMMLVNGTFVKSLMFKISLLFVLGAIAGSVFKIMHLPGGDEIMLLSHVALLVPYSIHFFRKENKNRTDVLKLLMFVSMVIIPPVTVLHLVEPNGVIILEVVSRILFGITFADFLYGSYKQGVLVKK